MFVGTFAIIIETISGGHIRPKIYSMVLKKIYEVDINHTLKRKKLNMKEIRFLFWIILVIVGFFLQLKFYLS